MWQTLALKALAGTVKVLDSTPNYTLDRAPARRFLDEADRRSGLWGMIKGVVAVAARALLMTENNLRKIRGYRDLWMLEAGLGRKSATSREKVA